MTPAEVLAAWLDHDGVQENRAADEVRLRAEEVNALFAPDPGAVVHLLTGPVPADLFSTGSGVTGRVLVTVYGDGSGEVAYRPTDESRVTWGPPAPLEPAP